MLALLRDTLWLNRESPWTQLMPVCYGVTRWSYDGDAVHAGRAAVLPRNKLALFRTPVRPGEPRLF